MKILGIDHGKKRVGVAVSDAGRTHAFPLEAVSGTDRHRLLTRLQELVEEHQVTEVVVGLPLTMLGEVGPQAAKVQEFVERLGRKLGPEVLVTTWDERLSSAQADRGRGAAKAQEGMRDMMAAVVILQSYLDSRSS
ncbi:MAG: Holliday junction resolvase RuvX [Vulcanimicrobiota bacterium]